MRMSLRMTVGLLLLVLSLHAQTGGIRPADLVAAARSARTTFTEYKDLFTPANGRDRLEAAIPGTDYTVLNLNEEQRATLLQEAPEALRLRLPQAGRSPLELDLVRVEIVDPSFLVFESSNQEPVAYDRGIHYRGVVVGQRNSIAAISVFDGEMSGLISTPEVGNLVLGKVTEERLPPEVFPYVLYNDATLLSNERFECGTVDNGLAYTREQLSTATADGRSAGCVRIYFEVDHDIYNNKGGTSGAVNYVEAIFNEVATLYANENINLAISEVLVWNTPSPYSGNSSSTLLNQFQRTRTSFNGDLGQLLSYQASGGIAVLDGLCHPYNSARLSFSSIGTSFRQVPTYSYTVMVVAHELGHLLGSQHTHACAWNGNGTAIDGCAGFTEGNCPNPGIPSNGGTIMSYCHISYTGINFTKGFGPQPGNVIRNVVASASCTQACAGGGGGGSGGGGNGGGNGGGGNDCENVNFRLVFDTYPMETSWEIRNSNGQLVESGDNYDKQEANTTLQETFCLPPGCYTITLRDSYNDGICCDYGNGSFTLTDANGGTLANGGVFGSSETADFCIGGTDGGGNGDCLAINFNDFTVQSYGANQDAGAYQIQQSGNVLYLENNAWKSIPLTYNISANTVLEFEFRSTRIGEIHGIGFDDNETITSGLTFQLYGTQSWGIRDFKNYPGNGQWIRYVIPVGRYYTGRADRLFFVADQDAGLRNGNSYFRNLTIYEGQGCNNLVEEPGSKPVEVPIETRLFPNPASTELNFEFSSTHKGVGRWTLLSITGQEIRSADAKVEDGFNRLTIPTDRLQSGTYLLRWRDEDGEFTHRFTVARK